MEPFISIRIKRKTAKKFQEFSKKNFKTHSETMEDMLDIFGYERNYYLTFFSLAQY
ncbi:BfmA/BtgA family mobilization protein [Leeuwenhoekiella sp. A16]|uniref:BfmA/BtgA family mobilization protein n=1 Tax=unclassified Leeuwenhoekiella TaxID=2615029 RepID=UPI003A802764